MIAGHLGIALAAKRVRERVALALLVIAAILPDLVETAGCRAGLDVTTAAMWSHSIPAVSILALLVAGGYWLVAGDGAGGALLGGLVVSHMLADYLTGRKPTWPGGPTIGLGLYAHPTVDFVLESAVIIAGWILYRRTGRTPRERPRFVLALLLVLLVVQVTADAGVLTGGALRKC